jgi:isoaspartyl peptidase/L-asparaginase-like protein (Ntn-hydrolase superfamily)
MLSRHEGRGGVIMVTPDGTVTAAFNTPRMAYAIWRSDRARVEARIDEPLIP